MKTCGSCGSTLADFDRFCGDCGAVIATSPADTAQPSQGALVTAKTVRRSKIKRGLVLGAVGLVLITTVYGVYFSVGDRVEPGALVRFALSSREDPEAKAEPKTAEEAADEQPEKPEAESQTEDEAPLQPPTKVEPGSWSFTTELFNVTKVDLSDTSFQISRQGIGSTESITQCVSPAIASNPRMSAFPFAASMNCRPASFVMGDNRYRSTLTCTFPQYGGDRPVEAEGQYSRDKISLTVRVRVPAEIVSGDFERPPEIYMDYKMTGYRAGGC